MSRGVKVAIGLLGVLLVAYGAQLLSYKDSKGSPDKRLSQNGAVLPILNENGPLLITTAADAILLKTYQMEILRSNLSDDGDTASTLTDVDVEKQAEEINMDVRKGKVCYAPGNNFKLFNFELENCGGTCFSSWITFVHFKWHNKEFVKSLETMSVDTIYQLPDGKFLLLESGFEHPIQAYYAVRRAAKVISFLKDSILVHPISYHGTNGFTFRHDDDNQPRINTYIKYSPQEQTLTYQYISNNSYFGNAKNIDSLRRGTFSYQNGHFEFQSEKISVREF
ncbi:hypothetical protein IDJ77_05915 [Mucilaginibacter sp. ZT4R22]|uniref:Uncharacterized protein n=1 Tax=Mucilaginibacter pankratovii TaxID=2772110 RepID=A0ABR7WLZ2_9SPHI|nr:hypothetical protein [Mucilaginibacter pankratovii]MBD1363343.1 hypothetical protein [Mucilaginibacter pankratovii]